MFSQVAFNPLPAVVIGGPPHSGKSVLTYSLTCALRARDVEHYVLRAYPPDYEGDWFLACDQERVRHLRIKGAQNESWLPLVQRDIARRHLPLIVDMGGLPTLEQESILDSCTHAILLASDAAGHDEWQDRFARHGLVLLADLHSDLYGKNELTAIMPVLQGTLAGLDRGRTAGGPAFVALVDAIAALFATATVGIRQQHLNQSPVELTVDLEQLARHMNQSPNEWTPTVLPAVLDYLPVGVPLALYGRGPNWLYAALALFAHPATLWQFDPRLGWISPPELTIGDPPPNGPLRVQVDSRPDHTRLSFYLPDVYLDYTEAAGLTVPPLPPTHGVVLDGKLSHWLLNGIALAYRHHPWLAVYQPQVNGAVVVYAPGGLPGVGAVIE